MATAQNSGLAATQKDANRREWGRTAEVHKFSGYVLCILSIARNVHCC